MSTPGNIHVGTSGWHYMEWKGPLYPEKLPSRLFLEHYQQHFLTSEINNTFYSLPKPETVQAWHDNTPGDFLFAVKASRFITHMKKLKDPATTLPPFVERLAPLKEKLGPLLFLIPPKWGFDEERFRTFLEALPQKQRCAFEPRDPSWHNDTFYGLLKDHGHALVIVDLKGAVSPILDSALFHYVRFHGVTGHGYGRYAEKDLKRWAKRFRDWTAQGKDVYAYFDNDDAGAAPQDALALKALVQRR